MIKLSDFIEYTEEIFAGVKNTVGERVGSCYFLYENQTLSTYVKDCKKKPNRSFTSANCSDFLNKCRYFIYPERRAEQYKADISVKNFSERCVLMFFKRFGINYSFLRITPELTDNKEFIAEQKRCLEDLFEQIIKNFMIQSSYEENFFADMLKLYYCRYRFDLYKVDMGYLLGHYDILMQSELNDYLIYTTDAFHKLKFIYSGSKAVGLKEFISTVKNQYTRQIKELNKTLNVLADVMKAKKKENVEKYLNKIFKEEYFAWREDKNWKLKFIHLYLHPNNGTFSLSTIAAYMLYFNDYQTVVNDFMKLCSDMAGMREEYAKFPVTNLIRFECMIYQFYFYILVAYQNAPESNE